MRSLLCILLASALFLSVTANAQEPAPLSLGYEGFVTDLSRQPITGDRDITFRLYRAQVGGENLWEETLNSIYINEGRFQVTLGLITPLPMSESPDSPLFMSIQLAGDTELQPRMRVGAAIRAQWSERSVNADVAQAADHAIDVRDEAIHPATVSIGDFPVIDADGRWVGQPITVSGGDPADPDAVAAALADDPEFQAEIAETLAAEQPEAIRGERGEQGERGERGEQGERGERGEQGEQGEQGEEGLQGEPGQQGAPGESVSLSTDADQDGFPDWVESMVGTNPEDPDDKPEDTDGDGVPDQLRGPQGAQGDRGEQGIQGQPGNQGIPGNVGERGPQGDPGPPGEDGITADLNCAQGQIAKYLNGAWACVADDSANEDLIPTSVAVGQSQLRNGAIDLGPEADDELTAAMVKTLTGGGQADALHTHAGQANGREIPYIVASSCYVAWGTTECGQGFRAMYEGYITTFESIYSASTGAGGISNTAPICSRTELNSSTRIYGGNILYTYNRTALLHTNPNTESGKHCAQCCPMIATCGNGLLELGETCDDGDSLACGQCNANCDGPGDLSTCP